MGSEMCIRDSQMHGPFPTDVRQGWIIATQNHDDLMNHARRPGFQDMIHDTTVRPSLCRPIQEKLGLAHTPTSSGSGQDGIRSNVFGRLPLRVLTLLLHLESFDGT